MRNLTIHSSTHDYDVLIGSSLRHQLKDMVKKEYSKVLIVSDSVVADLYLEDVKAAFSNAKVSDAIVPAGEGSKSLEQYGRLLDKCIQEQLDRQSLIVGLGGGMIGDLTGFVASTYLRGIDFLQMPTSILAHDSSVGGKVAINHPQGKNLIGSFYNPIQVVYDTETLQSLPAAEIRSGYGEVIKHALLSDASWYDELKTQLLKNVTTEDLEDHLMAGIKVKAGIVEEDEKEHGVRKYLNLGHTLAHALEAELGYGAITHGEAVALGIAFAMRVSEHKLKSDLPILSYLEWLQLNDYPLHTLKSANPKQLVHRMKWDKKTVREEIHFVLLKEVGSPVVERVNDEELTEYLEKFLEEVNHIEQRN
ncbi:3-dehydroquinate synthase [Halobacillus sp. Marseille-Q1614]|uniref:3-dehydroquinate synthase n=1 Tax=Halobacillus sp. Marseille-Q1614 TaxID=2709134 RepID=UPI00157006CA|nr:3-dehydroquinate synthase [Halobacillus sp. Marseille-Q1614]